MIPLRKILLEQTIFNVSKKIFGVTYNPSESGYILPDGEMLDFSGKSEGGSPR